MAVHEFGPSKGNDWEKGISAFKGSTQYDLFDNSLFNIWIIFNQSSNTVVSHVRLYVTVILRTNIIAVLSRQSMHIFLPLILT